MEWVCEQLHFIKLYLCTAFRNINYVYRSSFSISKQILPPPPKKKVIYNLRKKLNHFFSAEKIVLCMNGHDIVSQYQCPFEIKPKTTKWIMINLYYQYNHLISVCNSFEPVKCVFIRHSEIVVCDKCTVH